MKANAPEKIYVKITHPISDEYTEMIAFEDGDGIEYVRKDAFVEKACEWLKNSTYGYLIEKWGETEIDRETLALDFAKYMKG